MLAFEFRVVYKEDTDFNAISPLIYVTFKKFLIMAVGAVGMSVRTIKREIDE